MGSMARLGSGTACAAAALAAIVAGAGVAQAQPRERSGKQVVEAVCTPCHGIGKDNAPRIGDRPAWIPHMSKGLDVLVGSAIQGHGSMPPRGGQANLTDQELRSAIVYMFNYGLPELPPQPPVARADPFHKLVHGTDVYLGMMRADKLRAAQAASKGEAVRLRVPAGHDYYHINISLADSRSQAHISDAEVKLEVSDGMRIESRTLDMVSANDAISYGGFFRLASGGAYNITAEVKRPGGAAPFQARFEFKAP